MAAQLNDLVQIQAELGIPSAYTQDRVKLAFALETASSWIEEALGRSDRIMLKERTEYYDGTGTQRLQLGARPVWSSGLQVFVDDAGNYGSSSGSFASGLTYGDDFCLQIDQPDGSSRCGLLVRINGGWDKRYYRSRGLLTPWLGRSPGSIKVTYQGGFSIDNMPAVLREAVTFLVAKILYVLPLGMEIGSESYEERSIGLVAPQKGYLMSLVKPMIMGFWRNWRW